MKKAICLLVVFLLTGCTLHWNKIETKPDGADNFVPYSGGAERCSAVFADLRVKQNGLDVNASTDFQKRFATALKDTKLFESVLVEPTTSMPSRHVTFSLKVNENQDTNQGANVTKGFIIGLSLYVLTPIIPLSYDFESEMILQAARWDGKTKDYTAKGKGSAGYHLFANAPVAGNELRAVITNNNVNALMNQLVNDLEFISGI